MKASEKLKKIKTDLGKDEVFLKSLDRAGIIPYIIDQIQRRTRLGKGVSKSGELVKLAPLSNEKYKKKRKESTLDSTTRPNKSNLTFTGQLLKSIIGKRNKTIITFTLDDKRDDTSSTNSEIARGQADQGRRFFDLSKSERNGVSRKISQLLKEFVKKIFDN